MMAGEHIPLCPEDGNGRMKNPAISSAVDRTPADILVN
jgi:hypothetical protein